MTQEVQPLMWQKRTNLEEHQQFFSKINEIITNLAPTVDEAEAAIAQATQAIASANAAIATANAASASADAASQQAQTAASTVAGYDARLVAAESKNTQQDTAITSLQTADSQNVKLTGAQGITGIKTVPTEATGARSQQIANSAKVGAELDNYSPMVRDTGNKDILGDKRFINGLIGQSLIMNVPASGKYTFEVSFTGNTTQFAKVEVFDYINNQATVFYEFLMAWNGSSSLAKVYARHLGPAPSSADRPKFTVDNDKLKLIYYGIGYHTVMVNVTNARSWTNAMAVTIERKENPDYTGLTLQDVVE